MGVLIPATMGKPLSTFTMQMAYQLCKKFNIEAYRMNVYNLLSVFMGYLPWLFVDMVAPKEDKSKKRRKSSRKAKEEEEKADDSSGPEPEEKKEAPQKKGKKGKAVSKKK